MKVEKWGNSLAIRLPAVGDALGLKEGDEVEIHAADGKAVWCCTQARATSC